MHERVCIYLCMRRTYMSACLPAYIQTCIYICLLILNRTSNKPHLIRGTYLLVRLPQAMYVAIIHVVNGNSRHSSAQSSSGPVFSGQMSDRYITAAFSFHNASLFHVRPSVLAARVSVQHLRYLAAPRTNARSPHRGTPGPRRGPALPPLPATPLTPISPRSL